MDTWAPDLSSICDSSAVIFLVNLGLSWASSDPPITGRSLVVSFNPFVKLFICCLFWWVSVLSPLGVNECSFMAPLYPAAEGTERSFCLRDFVLCSWPSGMLLTLTVELMGGCAWFPCCNLSVSCFASIWACASNLWIKLNVFPTLSSM